MNLFDRLLRRLRQPAPTQTSRREFLVRSTVLGSLALALPALAATRASATPGTSGSRRASTRSRGGLWYRPPPIRPGDPIAVIAPSGPIEQGELDAGLARLAQRYRPILAEGLTAAERYLAGSDEHRAANLKTALGDGTRAIFCARGGYGAARILPMLPTDRPGKTIVGLSDITALHAAWQSARTVSIHGQVVTQLGRLDETSLQHLYALLEDPSYHPLFTGQSFVEGPPVEGRVVGGNFSVFSRLIGTPWMPSLEGAILFLEDTGEAPYRLDRMWHHMAQAGCFDSLAGIVLGTWRKCDDIDPPLTAATVLAEMAKKQRLPCLAGLPCGHGPNTRALPLGARARLDTRQGRLEFLEGAVGESPLAGGSR